MWLSRYGTLTKVYWSPTAVQYCGKKQPNLHYWLLFENCLTLNTQSLIPMTSFAGCLTSTNIVKHHSITADLWLESNTTQSILGRFSLICSQILLDRCNFQICTCRSETRFCSKTVTEQLYCIVRVQAALAAQWNQHCGAFLDAAEYENQHNATGEGQGQISECAICLVLFYQIYFYYRKEGTEDKMLAGSGAKVPLKLPVLWKTSTIGQKQGTFFLSRLKILPSVNCIAHTEI